MLPMIQETITYTCSCCGSTNIVRNGTNKCGKQQYHCKDCGAYRVLKPRQGYSKITQETVLKTCKERVSLRGVQRIFGISRHSVTHWIKHHDSRKNSGIRRKYQDMPIILDIFLMLTPSFFIPS